MPVWVGIGMDGTQLVLVILAALVLIGLLLLLWTE
jgi:hypothetical protein